MPPKVLIVVPTYNEMENLPALVSKIETLAKEGLGHRVDVLVIDDNSPDGTGAWAAEQARQRPHLGVIRRKGKLGLGSAYVRGFRYAMEKGYDFVFEMDADFSHNPDYLPQFLSAIQDADMVLGSRYVQGITVVNWPMHRLLLSWFANLYARLVTGLPLKDATGGYKCFRVDALRQLDWSQIRSDGYSFQIEVSFKIWKKGMRIKEIPIVFMDRTAGESKMSGTIISEALFLLIRLRLGL